MASVFPGSRTQVSYCSRSGAPRLARSMSWHASGALMLFAIIQIVGAFALSAMPAGRLVPFIALALVLLAAVPFSRAIERRWSGLAESALPCPGLLARYRRDRDRLWRFACIVPTLWLGLFAAAAQAASF